MSLSPWVNRYSRVAGPAPSVTSHRQQGVLELVIGTEEDRRVERLSAGDTRHLVPGTVHRFRAVEDCLLFEVSTPELDDVLRIEDDFGRAGTDAP